MLTIICVVVGIALLTVAGIFALMAKDSARKGKSGSGAVNAQQQPTGSRAPGLD